MYEEENKSISSSILTLIIKLVLLAIFVFILCWLYTRNGVGNKVENKNREYIQNITMMKDSAFEYFTDNNLPENIGGTKKLALEDMLNQKLLIDFTENGKSCNINSSYVQATKTADNNFALKVSLDCGKKSDFIVTTIEKQKCVFEGNCPLPEEKEENESHNGNGTNTSSSEENNGSSNNNGLNDNEWSDGKEIYDKNDKPSNNNNNNINNNNINNNNNNGGGSSNNQYVTTTTTVKTHVTITIKYPIPVINNNIYIENNNNCDNNCKPVEPEKPVEPPVEPEKPEPPIIPEEPEEPEKVRWYKHERWTEWTEGYSNAENAENRKKETIKYIVNKPITETIRTVSYIMESDRTPRNYSYTLKLLDYSTSEIDSLEVNNKSYFSGNDYEEYIRTRDEHIQMEGEKPELNATLNAQQLRNSSLTSSNFSFRVSDTYKKNGKYYVDVTINAKNTNGVTKYYDKNLGYSVYNIPLKFDVNYSLDKNAIEITEDELDKYKDQGYIVVDTKKEVTWEHRFHEYKWSTESKLEGWTYTGIYEDRIKESK